MPPSSQPQMAYGDALCQIWTWRSMVFHVFGQTAVPPDSAKELVKVLEKHGKAVGAGKLVEFTLLAPNAPIPAADTRAVLDAAVPIVSPFYGAVVTIFEGSGFKAALVRGIMTSFQMLSRSKYPQKVSSNVDDAVNWAFPYAKSVGVPVATEEDLSELVHVVRNAAIARGLFGPEAQPHVANAPPPAA